MEFRQDTGGILALEIVLLRPGTRPIILSGPGQVEGQARAKAREVR